VILYGTSVSVIGTTGQSLLGIDELLRLDTATSPRGAAAADFEWVTLKAGDEVAQSDGGSVRIPLWLKDVHPRHLGVHADNTPCPLVDYRLPVAGNVFYKRWSDLQASSSIGKALDSIDVLHLLLVGPSGTELFHHGLVNIPLLAVKPTHVISAIAGCGKTSAGFTLAAKRFVVLLQCPADGVTGLPSGYRMDHAKWTDPLTAPRTTSDVARLFCCEITARLVVLWNLILAGGEDVTPLYWLRYVLSAEGGTRIQSVLKRMLPECSRVSFDGVNDLIDKLRLHQGGGDGSMPFVFVDEAQLLGMQSVAVDGPKFGRATDTSVLQAAFRAAYFLDCGTVWGGTSVEVNTAHSQSSRIAKFCTGLRDMRVVHDFEHLTPAAVDELLTQLLRHNASSGVWDQLCRALQGRGGLVASFVTFLLTPAPGLNLRAADKSTLEDSDIGDALEEYLETASAKRLTGADPPALSPAVTALKEEFRYCLDG
jgi:hypothetical protein